MQTLGSWTVDYIVCKVLFPWPRNAPYLLQTNLKLVMNNRFIATGMCLKSLGNTIAKYYFKLLYDSNIHYFLWTGQLMSQWCSSVWFRWTGTANGRVNHTQARTDARRRIREGKGTCRAHGGGGGVQGGFYFCWSRLKQDETGTRTNLP